MQTLLRNTLHGLFAVSAIAIASLPFSASADALGSDDGRDFRFIDRIALTSGTAAGSSGQQEAEISVRDESTGREDAFTLSGFLPGTYTVSATTLSGTVPVEFPVTVVSGSDTKISGSSLPVDLLDIATFTVLSGSSDVIASGDFLGLDYVGGADHVSGKIHVNKKTTDAINTTVKAHLVINARIKYGTPKALFQMKVTGLPASEVVTLYVNGTSLGEFTTDKHGKLSLRRTPGKSGGKGKGKGKQSLPSELDVFSVRVITVADSLGTPYIEVALRD